MTEQHLSFNYSIFVDGKLAAQCVKDDRTYFEDAYQILFPKANIETKTVLQMAKEKEKAKETEEGDEE